MNNPLVDFLTQHKGVVYSTKTLKKRLGVNHKKVFHYMHLDENNKIELVKPLFVGSNKKKNYLLYCN